MAKKEKKKNEQKMLFSNQKEKWMMTRDNFKKDGLCNIMLTLVGMQSAIYVRRNLDQVHLNKALCEHEPNDMKV